MGSKTIILGNEYDNDLINRLKDALEQMNPTLLEKIEGIGGSQELFEYIVEINGIHIVINIETYIGISITGPSLIVDEILSKIGDNSQHKSE